MGTGGRLIHLHDYFEVVNDFFTANDGWPWNVIGVFPADDTPMPGAWWNCFGYTVGLSRYPREMELWAPNASVEGRMLTPQFLAQLLNRFGAMWLLGHVKAGDTIIVPLATVEEPLKDEDSHWWVGDPCSADSRSVNMSPAQWCLPMLWSSPLGWKEDE